VHELGGSTTTPRVAGDIRCTKASRELHSALRDPSRATALACSQAPVGQARQRPRAGFGVTRKSRTVDEAGFARS
jgi:hypothetical protein